MAERISFTRPSAERIARAVRTVENTRPGGEALRSRLIAEARKSKVFRICTYTGAWSIGETKAVSFKYQTATPNTVSATNLFFPITNTATASTRDCAIAKDGTAWFLVDVKFVEGTAIFVTQTQSISFVSATASAISVSSTASLAVVTDVSINASLNTSSCTISIGKTLITASRTFVTGTAATMIASGTATAVFVTGTATATYLRLE